MRQWLVDSPIRLAALMRVLARANEVTMPLTMEQLASPAERQVRGVALAYTQAAYIAHERTYLQRDYPSHTQSLKGMITGLSPLDGAILVVSTSEGLQPQAREQIWLAHQLQVPALLVFLNQFDQAVDEELLEVVELEVREQLARCGFASSDIPIIHGSALQALESQGDLSPSDPAARCIWQVLDAVRTCFPTPVPAHARPFLMQIEEVFDLKRRGIAAVGMVERGMIRAGAHVEISGMEATNRPALVTELQRCQKTVTQAQAGDAITCFLSGIARAQIERGQVIALPGSIQPSTAFAAHIYLLTQEEGGRHRPFVSGYRTCFFLRLCDIVGTVTLPESIEEARPGDSLEIEVQLCLPVAIEEGMRFALREGGRIVGVGICTRRKNDSSLGKEEMAEQAEPLQ